VHTSTHAGAKNTASYKDEGGSGVIGEASSYGLLNRNNAGRF
jgi:hypothetical protein